MRPKWQCQTLRLNSNIDIGGMAELQDKWTQPDSTNDTEYDGPLKPQIQSCIGIAQNQKRRLAPIISKVEARDKSLLFTIAGAKDRRRARVLAGELAELRKVKRTLYAAHLQLERLEMRMTMCDNLGDVASVIAPVAQTMRGVGAMLSKFIPNAGQELSQMAQDLSGSMYGMSDMSFGTEDAVGAEKIMEEAAAVAMESTKSKFPSTAAPAHSLRTNTF